MGRRGEERKRVKRKELKKSGKGGEEDNKKERSRGSSVALKYISRTISRKSIHKPKTLVSLFVKNVI